MMKGKIFGTFLCFTILAVSISLIYYGVKVGNPGGPFLGMTLLPGGVIGLAGMWLVK